MDDFCELHKNDSMGLGNIHFTSRPLNINASENRCIARLFGFTVEIGYFNLRLQG